MKLVIQRTIKASVIHKEKVVAKIGKGMLILVGISKNDNEKIIKKMAKKVLKFRIFPDDHRDINRSIQDIRGEILAVSQFTLLADTSAGNRPSFINAAHPEVAKKFFNLFVEELKNSKILIQTGIFGEYMHINLINDGPVTIIYPSHVNF